MTGGVFLNKECKSKIKQNSDSKKTWIQIYIKLQSKITKGVNVMIYETKGFFIYEKAVSKKKVNYMKIKG